MSTCPACGSEIKEVPAGVSKKTGKPYNAFQVCSNQACGWKPTQKPGFNSVLVENHKPNAPQDPPLTNQQREKAMFYSYAKDLAIAEVAAGLSSGPIAQLVKLYFRELWNDFINPPKDTNG